MKIIKQELQFEKCLKQRIEFICEFSKVTSTFINGSIRKLEKTKLLVANFSIPFCKKECFNQFWNKIVDSILKERLFCG